MSTRTAGLILLVMTVLTAVSLLTSCTTTIDGHGTTTIRVSDDCRSGIDPGDPAWWPLCGAYLVERTP